MTEASALAFNRDMTPFCKGAKPQVDGYHQQQHNTENAQRIFIDIPVGRELHDAEGKNNSAQQNIAQPVGGNAQRKIRVMVLPGKPRREYRR